MITYCNGLMDHLICCKAPKGKMTPAGRKMALSCSECPKLSIQLSPRLNCPEKQLKSTIPECSRSAVRKHIQSQTKPWYLRSCPVGAENPLRIMTHLARTEGIGTLWSGLPATIVMAFPATILYFTSFEQFNATLLPMMPDKYVDLSPAFAGAFARLVTATIVSPLELVRTRMQMDNLSWSETWAAGKASYKSRGTRSFFLGYGATLLRDVPFSAIYFGLYKKIQSLSLSRDAVGNNFIAASIASAVAGTLTLPFDVIKTRQQVLLGSDLSHAHSIPDICRAIGKESGFRGFLLGYSPRLMKVVPACAIMMCSYEYSKAYFINNNPAIR